MTARFGSADPKEGLVTCKIASTILERFFDATPVRRLRVLSDVVVWSHPVGFARRQIALYPY